VSDHKQNKYGSKSFIKKSYNIISCPKDRPLQEDSYLGMSFWPWKWM